MEHFYRPTLEELLNNNKKYEKEEETDDKWDDYLESNNRIANLGFDDETNAELAFEEAVAAVIIAAARAAARNASFTAALVVVKSNDRH